jgi:putative CocE/NonD family hydrolase
MRIVTEFPHHVDETPDMGIVLSDGCRLSARVWMPKDAMQRPVPAVLEYIPYRKRDGTLPRDEIMHPYVAGHGYASVRVDMRGNGDSQGLMSDEYTEQELSDACEVIAWLAAQPWCTGAVGMMGKSWGGFNCLQTAFLQPPALKAVITVCSTTDRFADDIHYRGGCLLGENFGWGAVMLSYSSRPADPDLRADWREDWLRRLEAQPWLAPLWAQHQDRGAYWQHGSVCEDYARMTIPVLSWGGWADNYMNTVAHLVENVPAPVKGIVGPWVHQYPHTAVPGPAIGFLQEAIRWWDRWLKGDQNGAEDDPAYRAYMLHSEPPNASPKHRAGHWVAEAQWPSPRITHHDLALGAGKLGHFGAFRAIIATPQHLGMHTGEFFPMGLNAEMPGDQASDDAMSICFEGDVLTKPLDLMGAAKLTLTVASDKPLAFIVARLCDVGPDGRSVRIAHGMLNLCHRESMATPTPMVAGQNVQVSFLIDQMAYRLLPGHHLRLALSNSYWPFVWPSPEPVSLTVTSGSLSLPIHQGSAEEWTPPPAEGAQPWAHKVLRSGKATRKIETNLIDGTSALIVNDDQGDSENLQIGICSGESMSEHWEIHPDDPQSARAIHTWEQRISRGNWRIRTNVWAEMTSTATHFVMKAKLTAYEADEIIFERVFDDQVARRFV